jgi:AmmeMemoRadiSam system protein B
MSAGQGRAATWTGRAGTGRPRRPAAAGSFYPDDPAALARLVDRLLAGAAEETSAPRARALIAPHAGYVYSGQVAAVGYVRLARAHRVLLLGPAHFVALRGCVAPAADAWTTPLGVVPIDAELRDRASRLGARVDDRPHEPEHALEVQLPFLQRVLPDGFSILPVAVGVSGPPDVADLIGGLADDTASTVVVVSTDLSHYHASRTARRLDTRTAAAIVAREPMSIGPFDACGVYALRGLVEHARRHDLPIRLLDLRNSSDTVGDPARVVGYGAFVI